MYYLFIFETISKLGIKKGISSDSQEVTTKNPEQTSRLNLNVDTFPLS